jgi:hypothetical protein
MSKLTELGVKYGTDKTDYYHTFAGECYTDIYNKHISYLCNAKSFNFLEIGIKDGSSLNMWSEYFPNAQIIGIDINPECKQYEKNNISVEIGSQEDEEFLKHIINKYKNFAIVLDDGSHINSLTLKSFNVLQPYATDFYIIEDLRNSYEDLTDDVKLWPGMNLNKNLDARNNLTRTEFNDTFLSLVKTMDYRTGNYKGIYFYQQILILEKIR